MKAWGFFAALVLLAGPAFAQGLAMPPEGKAASPQARTLVVDGTRREYLLHRPREAAGPMPLVVLLHGGTQTAQQVWRQTSLPILAAQEGFLLAVPQGLERQWNDGRGSTVSGRASDADDVAFLHTLIAELVAHEGADPRAVFMVGASNGGFMTMYFACHHAGDLHAAASVVANLPVEVAQGCKPAKPLPWLAMNGTRDPLIPFEGQASGAVKNRHAQAALMTADASFDFWADHAGCARPAVSELLPGATESVYAERRTLSGCADGASSVQYVFHGSGHNWPGLRNGPVVRALGGSSEAVDAGSAIWAFFKATLPR